MMFEMIFGSSFGGGILLMAIVGLLLGAGIIVYEKCKGNF
jgi:hypothetical protein